MYFLLTYKIYTLPEKKKLKNEREEKSTSKENHDNRRNKTKCNKNLLQQSSQPQACFMVPKNNIMNFRI